MDYLISHWELISLAADGVAALILYSFYNRSKKEVELLSEAPVYDLDFNIIGDVLKSNSKSLPYACVRGTVKTDVAPLNSKYTDAKGVIQDISLYEHRSKRIQSSWFDQTKEIKNTIHSVPFYLTNSKSKVDIKIKNALESEYLLFNLQTVHDSYTPTKTDGFGKVVDVLSGEVVKGHSISERMLVVGAPLTAFGMVKLNQNNSLVLKPSSNGNRYILSTLSRKEIIEDVKHAAHTYKIYITILLGFGGIIFAIWMKRKYNERKESLKRRREASIILQRDLAATENPDDNTSICTICLTQPRNRLLLPCRHIVTCEACTNALPHPQLCPVCREVISNDLPIYLS